MFTEEYKLEEKRAGLNQKMIIESAEATDYSAVIKVSERDSLANIDQARKVFTGLALNHVYNRLRLEQETVPSLKTCPGKYLDG